MAALALEKDDEPDIFGDGEPAPTTPAAKPPAPPPDLSGKKTKAKTGKDAENQVDDRSAKATRRALNWQLAQAEDAQDKKCRDCKKFKPASSYNQDQSSCKECFNDLRSFLRVCDSQNQKQRVLKLQEDEPQVFAALFADFLKQRKSVRKAGSRIKFNVANFLLEWRKKEGVWAAEEGELMWISRAGCEGEIRIYDKGGGGCRMGQDGGGAEEAPGQSWPDGACTIRCRFVMPLSRSSPSKVAAGCLLEWLSRQVCLVFVARE